jgi:hypothetical protein
MRAVPTSTMVASSRTAGNDTLTRCTATVGGALTDGSSLADADAPGIVIARPASVSDKSCLRMTVIPLSWFPSIPVYSLVPPVEVI